LEKLYSAVAYYLMNKSDVDTYANNARKKVRHYTGVIAPKIESGHCLYSGYQAVSRGDEE
jgi:hypothetical protein